MFLQYMLTLVFWQDPSDGKCPGKPGNKVFWKFWHFDFRFLPTPGGLYLYLGNDSNVLLAYF